MDPRTGLDDPAEVIRQLRLEPLPQEGGWFRRVAESEHRLPDGRRAWSSIHALFTPEAFSAFHRVDADEIWCFHAGDPLELYQLGGDVTVDRTLLGPPPATGTCLQAAVGRGTWQAARVAPGGRWSLVTCVVVPEFRWDGFELGIRGQLLAAYPSRSDVIFALTRWSAALQPTEVEPDLRAGWFSRANASIRPGAHFPYSLTRVRR